VEFYFHLDIGLSCRPKANAVKIFKETMPLLTITSHNPDTEFRVNNGWVSRAYNRKKPTEILSWKANIEPGDDNSFTHTLHPFERDIS